MSDLADAIRDYHALDPLEEKARKRILAHVEAGGDLFARTRWDGHLTGSAFVLDARGEKLLLLFHKKLQRWLQPGGHGDPGEVDPFVVARREATEETGIHGLALHPRAKAPFDLDVHLIPARPDEPAHEHLDVRYVFLAPEGAQPVPQIAETSGAAWVSLEDAARDGQDESVARVARKLLAL